MQSRLKPYRPDQSGNIAVILILVVLLVASLGFGFWAYAGMADYKNNVNKKIAAASEIVKQQTATEKDKEYAEKDKSPYKKYDGPPTFGAVSFQYPKTWNAYIVDGSGDQGGDPVTGYLNPKYVPSIDSGAKYALRFKILNQPYDEVLTELTGDGGNPALKVTPFRAKNVPSVLGSRLTGTLGDNPQVSLVLVPIRDKSVEIWTESNEFAADFENVVLPSLSFSP